MCALLVGLITATSICGTFATQNNSVYIPKPGPDFEETRRTNVQTDKDRPVPCMYQENWSTLCGPLTE
jgi:hypothetical protein